MANNANDIKDTNAELNKYNDSLQDSINLSRIISDNIALLAGSMNRVGEKGRTIVTDLKEYNKAANNTVSLSSKLASGKLKEQEVVNQIASLQQKYNKYLEDSNKRGSYIKDSLKAQRNLTNEIAEKQKVKNRLELEAENLYDKRKTQVTALQKALNKETRARNSGNTALLATAQTEKQIATDKIKAFDYGLAEQNRIIDNNEKILSKKKQELDRYETINKAHKDLKKQYENEIKDNKAILAALEKQNSLQESIKNEAGAIGDRIKNNVKELFSFSSIFEFLKKTAFAVSDQVTKLQKGLVLSKNEAYKVRQEFSDMAVSTNDVTINTARLLEANASLGKQLGFNSTFTKDLNVQFVKLTKQLGLSEEAAGGLAKLSIATGATLEDTKNIAYETTQGLSSQYGIQLSQQEVLEEIGKLSGQTLAMFKANPKALAEAVAQAKLLGTTLEQTKKQAGLLLDFETSIENELQAELLTGKQLNLERARTAALMGDQTTVMQELANQNIDFNKYSNMNVIAQDKVAAALGLSSDELSNQLLKQQYLGKSREEVAALAGEEIAERVEAINAQDKFNLAVEKMQDLFSNIVGGPLGKFADMMADLASSSFVVYGILSGMAALSLGKLIASLITMATTLAGSAVAGGTLAAFLNPVNLAIGLGAIAVIGGLLGSAMSSAGDAVDTGDMFSSKGKTIVSPKEGGLFSLSDNDEFAAAPGLGDMISNSNRQTVVTQDNSALIAEIRALKAEMTGTKDGINQLNRKEGVVKINGQSAGTAQMMGNYNLA